MFKYTHVYERERAEEGRERAVGTQDLKERGGDMRKKRRKTPIAISGWNFRSLPVCDALCEKHLSELLVS